MFERAGTAGHVGGLMPVEASYEEVAYQFTAGILEHAGALTAVLAPTVNSYKLTAAGRADERDLVGAGVPGVRA